jgi:oligoendopeptidase F
MKRRLVLGFALALCLVPFAVAEATERSEVPAKYKWNLADLYPSEAAWTSARDGIAKRIPQMSRFQGRLGVSAESLAIALDQVMKLSEDLQRLYTYSSQLADEDQRVSSHIGMRESAEKLNVDYNAATAFVQPEILSIGATKIHDFVAREPKLKVYQHYLDDILRAAPHTLSASEEKIVAQAGAMATAGQTIRDIFANAELPYPTIRLKGEDVRLDAAAYTQYRQSTDRAERDSVFHAFWSAHELYKGTLGAALNAEVKAHVFNRDVHHYKSCVEAALFSNNIPVSVYTRLVSDAHANLSTLHRYLRLRKKMMGVDTLRYEDLYAPIVKEVEMKYTPEQAMETVLGAVAPLGTEYVETLKNGMTGGWIDWMPTTGKASGAYSTGAYGVHPYQLQNFTGQYDEVGTLAHESGHSMHTWYANNAQAYVNSNYATFVAEVASTLNENLLFHYMVDRTKDRNTKLFLLGTYLEGLRTTMFRQVLFAEFELKIHEMGERGEPLTGESLNKLYLQLVRQYYGHAQGVCIVRPLYEVEWAYIPHFYYNFYVYQYATSILASNSLANAIRQEAASHPAKLAKRDAYLALLKSGGSKYPIDELKEAGVDMTTSAPFQAAMREMNSVMDQMEKLLRSR